MNMTGGCELSHINMTDSDLTKCDWRRRLGNGGSGDSMGGWVAGWLGVCHSRYCIKTTKSILKLFRPSGSPIILAFRTPYADTKFQGEPLHLGRIIHGVGKIGDFQRILRYISETVRYRPMVTMER